MGGGGVGGGGWGVGGGPPPPPPTPQPPNPQSPLLILINFIKINIFYYIQEIYFYNKYKNLKMETEENISKLLMKYFDKKNKGKQKTILEEQIASINENEKKVEYCKRLLKGLKESPFNSYVIRDDTSIKIYPYLFYILKNKFAIDTSEPIFFDIIYSLHNMQKLAKLKSFNILVQILKDEKKFILIYFRELLDKLVIPLLSEKDMKLRNNGYYLDQIIKDGIGNLFQNKYIDENNQIEESMEEHEEDLNDKFELIYTYLMKKLEEKDIFPQIKILVISWFYFLESLPGQDLSKYYKDIIIKILNIVKSENKEVSNMGEIYIKKIIDVIIYSNEEEKFNLDFIKEILESFINIENINNNKEQYKGVLFHILKKFLEKLSNTYDKEILRKEIPFELFPKILRFILKNIIYLNKKQSLLGSNEISNENKILKLNNIFSDLIKKVDSNYFEPDGFNNNIDNDLLKNLDEKSTNIVFEWITQLYTSKLFTNEDFLKDLIINMKDLKDFHIKKIIGVVHMIKANSSQYKEKDIIDKILEKFNDQKFAEEFGFFIFNELSDESNLTVDIIDIYREIAENLKENNDISFVMNMIDLLTQYLIKEERAKKVIDALNKDKEFFKTLYKVFCLKPFDTLVLLLISKYFELSYFFVLNLSKMDLEPSDLIELSKAVQIFESNFFIDVRIQLLNPKSNIYLIKTMYAILLLLPPGPALKNLNNRLRCLEILYDFDEEEKKNDNKILDIDINDFSVSISEINENNFPKVNEGRRANEEEKNIDDNNELQKLIKEYISIFNEQQENKKETLIHQAKNDDE